jgi:hypothetical protein
MAERTILVTGSAEKEIVPDKIWFLIGLQEYYEGQSNYYYDDYGLGDKVKITEIDKLFKSDMSAAGIDTNMLITENMGNYYSYYGADNLLTKQYKIRLDSMSQVEFFIENIETEGIQYMRIGPMDHSEMETLRQEVKKEALLAAQKKAEYLLSSLDKKVGDVISITEMPNYAESYPYYYGYADEPYSNATMAFDGEENGSKKLKLRYEMQVQFAIE